MTDKLIPANARRAAARGFIRTASQSLATSFIGFGGLTIALTGDGLLALAVGIGGATVTAALNGAQSYFSLLAKGIPEDYAPDLDTAGA